MGNEVEQKLDTILEITGDNIITSSQGHQLYPYKEPIIIDTVCKKLYITQKDFSELADILVKDGYAKIEFMDNTAKYLKEFSITYRGKMFGHQGGYAGQLEYKNQEQARLRQTSKYLLVFSILTAFGAVTAAVYYGLQIWEKFHTPHCH
jgi:hypothetical protein